MVYTLIVALAIDHPGMNNMNQNDSLICCNDS